MTGDPATEFRYTVGDGPLVGIDGHIGGRQRFGWSVPDHQNRAWPRHFRIDDGRRLFEPVGDRSNQQQDIGVPRIRHNTQSDFPSVNSGETQVLRARDDERAEVTRDGASEQPTKRVGSTAARTAYCHRIAPSHQA